jgi:hypothetical protein
MAEQIISHRATLRDMVRSVFFTYINNTKNNLPLTTLFGVVILYRVTTRKNVSGGKN